MRWSVRDATVHDAAACAAIYATYVTGTAITFESDPPDEAEVAARIAAALRTHAWLVLEQDIAITGAEPPAGGGPALDVRKGIEFLSTRAPRRGRVSHR